MNAPSAVATAIAVLSLVCLGTWYLLARDVPAVPPRPKGPEAALISGDASNCEDAIVAPVRTAADTVPALSSGSGSRTVRVRVLDVDRHDPVAGVAVRIEAAGLCGSAITDVDGRCELAWPSPSGWAQLFATPQNGVVLDTPRRLAPDDRLINLVFARSITLFGTLRDPQGRGVAQARIYLTAPKSGGNGREWLESSSIAQTDAAGIYRVEVKHGWPAGSHLVGVSGPWVPAVGSLADVRASALQVDLQFTEGMTWRVRVLDEDGRSVAGCKLRVMTSDSPLLGDWMPDEVPEGAGGDLGLVSQLVVTDGSGIGAVGGWPAGRGARVRIFNDQSRRFCVIGASGVVRESGRPTTIAASDLSNAEIHVRIETRTSVRISGRLEGFAADEVGRLRVTRLGDGGGSERAPLRLLEAGAFEAEFSMWRSDLGHRIDLVLMATMEGTDWRQDLGTYEIHGDPVLPGLIIRR